MRIVGFFIIIGFLLVSPYFLYSQNNNEIVITDWVNRPDDKEMEKPLLFIDFWATWCVPCIHAMPQTEILEKKFHDNVLFVLVSDESQDKVKEFMQKHNKSFYSAIDNSGKTYTKYSIKTIPYSLLLNPKGKIIWRGQPTELSSNKLSFFVKKYKNKTGAKTRIKLKKIIYQEDKWLGYTYDSVTMYYMINDSFTNNFSVDNNEYYFSGDLKHLVSMAYDVSLKSVISNHNINQNCVIKCKTSDYNQFVKLIKNFLLEVCKTDVRIKKESVDAYLLQDNGDNSFLPADTYDFEKGNNSFLASDMNVTIDNATIEEMTDILSDLSGDRFIYNGENKNRYDWKIHYKFIDLTLEQLSGELNFSVEKGTEKINYLYLDPVQE